MSDFLTSSRGPGVIGMLIALFVIVGFGSLFFFVFDEEMQGHGKSLEAVVRDQDEDIENKKADIVTLNGRLDDMARAKKAAAELGTVRSLIASNDKKFAALGLQAEATQASLAAVTKEFEEYRESYRAMVRKAAIGRTFPEFKLATGAVYKNAEIREVSAIGIQIRHEDGSRRIPFEELEPALQVEFVFDAEEKADQVKSEQAMAEQYDAALKLLNDGPESPESKEPKKMSGTAGGSGSSGIAPNGRMTRELAGKIAQLKELKDEIQLLNEELDRIRQMRRDGRQQGSGAGDRTLVVKARLDLRRSQYAAVLASVNRLQDGKR